jgi:hypothetical protein
LTSLLIGATAERTPSVDGRTQQACWDDHLRAACILQVKIF